MVRRPIVGSDYGIWGGLENEFLSVAHNADGTLKSLGRYLYLPLGWDDAWIAAKANAGSQRVDITAIGDSITNGWNATDIMVDSWWAKFRASLLASNSLAGDFYSMLYSSSFAINYGGPGTATPPLIVSGAYGDQYSGTYGAFGINMYTSGFASPLLTCTPPYDVVGFDIIYLDFAAGTWNYKIDSGSTVNVTCTGPSSFDGAIVKKITITGLAVGTHTLTINAPNAGGICNIEGITAYKATTGLCFANMGIPGQGLYTGSQVGNALANTTQFPPDRIALYQGYQGTTASPTSLIGLGFPAQPDLAIIALGVNDAGQSVSRANFRDTLDRLIWSLRYGKNDACSIIIMAMWAPDGTAASSTTVTSYDYDSVTHAAYRDLKAAMLECAQVNNCAFVDVHSLFGRFPVTNQWIASTSDLHPSSAGHLKIANLIGTIV
jgi:lysophospholipase L1-like esterase